MGRMADERLTQEGRLVTNQEYVSLQLQKQGGLGIPRETSGQSLVPVFFEGRRTKI